jgi:hypothetical protein
MRPVPAFLPSAHSAKWHNRRWWDSMGYLRVRTLANPKWDRDPVWLIGVMDRTRPQFPSPERDLYDAATAELRLYGAAGARRGVESEADFLRRREDLWDNFLTTLDTYLEQVQAEHLRDVDEAGTSGRPPAL